MPIYKQKQRNSEGLFKYKVRINYVDSSGNYKQLTRSVWGLAAAKDLEIQLNKSINQKEFTNTGLTVRDLFDEYFEINKKDIRATTMRGRKTNYDNHIQPHIDNIKIKDLNTPKLNLWKKQINNKELSLKTKKNIYSDLHTVLNYAVKQEYLVFNPLDKVDNFKDATYQKPEIDFYTPEDFSKFKAAALQKAEQTKYYDYYVFFCLAYYTGCRKGEIHALRWNCIDFTKGTLQVKKSISQKLKGDDVETPPKNKSSIRKIQMPQPLKSVLQEHRQRQQASIPDWNESGFICGYYRPLRDTSIENENKDYASKACVKKIRIHDFRHSHASLLINKNVNPLEVAKRLGHSTVDQTLKTYAHLFPSNEEASISVLDSVI